VVCGSGTEFSKEFAELLKSTGIEEVINTVKNPRANAVLEQAHEVMGSMPHAFDFENQPIGNRGKDKHDPFEESLSAVAFAISVPHVRPALEQALLLWHLEETCSSQPNMLQIGKLSKNTSFSH